MAKKITELPAVTTAAVVDLFETVQDPVGTPISKKVSTQQMITDVINPNAQLEGTDQVSGLDPALAGKLDTSGGSVTGNLTITAGNILFTNQLEAASGGQVQFGNGSFIPDISGARNLGSASKQWNDVHGVTGILNTVSTDTITEKTAANGVVIDGTLIKDNKITSGGASDLQLEGASGSVLVANSGLNVTNNLICQSTVLSDTIQSLGANKDLSLSGSGTGVVEIVDSLKINSIGERSADAGVTIDGVLLKDTDVVADAISASGGTLEINSSLSSDNTNWLIQYATGNGTFARVITDNIDQSSGPITITGDISSTDNASFNQVSANISTNTINTITTNGTQTINVNGTGLINFKCNNTSVNSSSNVRIEQEGSGDAVLHFLLTGTKTISIGIDNSTTNNNFVISETSAGLGSTDLLVFENGDTTKNFYPGADNTYSWGKSGNRWTAIWATNGTIQTSGAAEKENINYSTVPGKSFIQALKPASYNWKNSAANETHCGFVAEEVEAALQKLNYPNLTQGIIVKETVTEEIENGETGEKESMQKTVYGMNYSQLIPCLVKCVQEMQAEIEELKNAQ